MGWKIGVTAAIIIMGSFAYTHEVAHYTVAKEHGCEASIDWTPDYNSEEPAMSSISSVDTLCPEGVTGAHNASQSNVEATGYQLIPIYGFMALLFLVILSA